MNTLGNSAFLTLSLLIYIIITTLLPDVMSLVAGALKREAQVLIGKWEAALVALLAPETVRDKSAFQTSTTQAASGTLSQKAPGAEMTTVRGTQTLATTLASQ